MQDMLVKADGEQKGAIIPSNFRGLVWFSICSIVVVYFCILAAQTVLRIRFPWDLSYWPESPFMVDMVKLSNHQPVYSDPHDVNSFVYSPGLEYLTFAILKPFGLALDIRFCRLVSILIGLAAAGFGVAPVLRLLRSMGFASLPKWFPFISFAVFWLVLSQNFLSDVPHPDNFHTLHATMVFALTFAAVESGNFGTAMAAMVVAGLGVFTKQTEAASLIGPAFVFAVFNKWGARRWCVLVATGAILLGISLYLLWLPTYSKFYTLELLSHQKIYLHRLLTFSVAMCSGRRGGLLFLSAIAGIFFWRCGGVSRRYVVCWAAVGACCALPNFMAFIKVFGAYNNLGIMLFWLALLFWPFAANSSAWLKRFSGEVADEKGKGRSQTTLIVFNALLLCFVAWLVPLKNVPRPKQVEYCKSIETAVSRDVQAGKKVLVTQGAEFYIHSIAHPPVFYDQANSALELKAGGQAAVFSKMRARIQSHYYDRIYLRMGDWFGDDFLAELYQYYKPDSVIRKVSEQDGGPIAPGFMEDCKILSPRE